MKKSLKIAILIVMLIATVFAFSINSYAIDTDIKADSLTGKGANTGTATEQIQTVGNTIISVAINIAVVAAVVTIVIIGIKYIVGSAEQKADYKKSLIPMVVGVSLVVFATKIVTMLFGIG